jgi:periplasmic protein TonB
MSMQAWEILKADVLDILFDNRNKQYGAYMLRRHYPLRLKIALGLTLSSVLFMSLLFRNAGDSIIYTEREKPVVHVIEIAPFAPLPKPPEAPPPPRRAQSSYSDQMKIVANPDEKRMMKTVEDISMSAIGGSNVDGPADASLPNMPDQAQSKETTATPAKADAPAFEVMEQQPEFPGGARAWVNYLNRNLQTPADLEPGEKKIVLIKFIVDADGSVTGFTVVRSGGYAFDNEVIRVLRKMPKWKPAIQNGHAVTVSFTQPVTFVGLEE